MKRYHLYHPKYGWAVLSPWKHVTFYETPQDEGITTLRWHFEDLRKQGFWFEGALRNGEEFQIKELP